MNHLTYEFVHQHIINTFTDVYPTLWWEYWLQCTLHFFQGFHFYYTRSYTLQTICHFFLLNTYALVHFTEPASAISSNTYFILSQKYTKTKTIYSIFKNTGLTVWEDTSRKGGCYISLKDNECKKIKIKLLS